MRQKRAAASLGRHRGIPLFSVLGIRVIADYSWFLIVALIATTLTMGWFPSALPGLGTVEYAFLGIITAFFFFASVLVHELAHSLVATRHGIPVRKITLFMFGGVAEIVREPADPRTELKVALAGPAVSAFLAAALWTAVLAMGGEPARPGLQLALIYLAFANSLLLAFNLLPGLPLDGGRVLRALLWKATGSLLRATYVASVSGKAIAGLLVVAGVVAIFSRTYLIPGLWFIFIALFLRRTADKSYRQMVIRESLEGIRVASVMVPGVVTVPSEITLAELIESHLLRHHFISYPVVDSDGPAGLITIRLVKQVPRESWGVTTVAEAMHPLGDDIVLSPDDTVAAAMQKMASSGFPSLLVLSEGRLVGVITRRDIGVYLEIRSDLSA
jgi:Zn-dependent protease/CBS domain-containing protein